MVGGLKMSVFEWVELGFIIVEFISIIVEIGLQIYEIKSSKKMEEKIMNRFDKIEKGG